MLLHDYADDQHIRITVQQESERFTIPSYNKRAKIQQQYNNAATVQ